MKNHKAPLFISLILLTLCSLVRYSDNTDYLILDFLSHFIFQYSLLALVLMAVCVWRKSFLIAVLAGFLFIFNIASVVDLGESIQAAGDAGTSFKVYSANLYISNDELSRLNREVQEIDPDILLLLEVTPQHKEQLRPLVLSYPYRVENISDEALGFIFLSKFPVHNYKVTRLSDHGNSILEAMLEINQKAVMFYGVHAQRPRLGNYDERVSQFLRLARQINEQSQSVPVIVAGDFNATPYSPIFREVVKITGLRDSREGFGWQPSWPSFFPLLWMPIDHVLVTPDINVRTRATGSYIGSDHYPVIAELFLG